MPSANNATCASILFSSGSLKVSNPQSHSGDAIILASPACIGGVVAAVISDMTVSVSCFVVSIGL
jgi:hypothetical protein